MSRGSRQLLAGCLLLPSLTLACRSRDDRNESRIASTSSARPFSPGALPSATAHPNGEERALAAALREPFRKHEQFRISLQRRWPPGAQEGPDTGALVFAWGKGARWYYGLFRGGPDVGSTLHVWRWARDELSVLELHTGRVRRSPFRGGYEELALAFLFDDFSERFALERLPRDESVPLGAAVDLRARYRSGATDSLRELRLMTSQGTRPVLGASLIHDPNFIVNFSFSPPEPLPGPPLPESCFALQSPAGDAEKPTSPCPTDELGR